ncbi:MAG: peptidase S41, partial [Muribaculaceae bacterium]|nr:peptidase S41 [Muribaculaceae bacterium]
MRKSIYLLLFIISMILPSACHPVDSYDTDPRGNFEALCDILDNHYCFFREKNIDWDNIRTRYAAMIAPDMSSQELFQVCSDMLGELRDGHTNLSTPFATSYYRAWWSDYPQNYNARIIEQNYF